MNIFKIKIIEFTNHYNLYDNKATFKLYDNNFSFNLTQSTLLDSPLVVTVDVSIASLKVTVREMFGATDEAESEGYVDEIVGVVLLFEVSSSAVVTALLTSESLKSD